MVGRAARFKYSKKKSLYHFGIDEWIDKLGLADERAESIAGALMGVAARIPEEKLREWWVQGGHIRRRRNGTLTKLGHVIEHEGSQWVARVGFDAPSGGFPALFLDVGTPHITPRFFVFAAFQASIPDVMREMELHSREIFKLLEA